MKNLFTLILFGIFAINSSAQIINANPDPNGEPWIIGKIPEYTPEYIQELDEIPELELTPISAQTPLPSVVDNSVKKYMRKIFRQEGQSCAQAAGVAYNFTYEVSRLRNIDNTSDTANYYPTHFTYNFLNMGNDTGSNIIDGWHIVKEQGCPTVMTWGGMAGDCKRWMTGYEKYDTSFSNRLISYSKITITDTAKLTVLKHWLSDHNEGDSIGGLCNFIAKMAGSSLTYVTLPPESPEAGKTMIADFGSVGRHALTIVGYNDSIKYDYYPIDQGDGEYHNDLDQNRDGIIDIRDWEIGAVKVANSWGPTYWHPFDSGFVYVPYRLLAEETNGIEDNLAYVIQLDTVKPYIRPNMILKLKMEHPSRGLLYFKFGYGNVACEIEPAELISSFPFSNHGGAYPMQGINEDPIEVEFDFSYYYGDKITNQNTALGKIFLNIYEQNPLNEEATIHSFSMVDYRWNEEFVLTYDSVPIEFSTGADNVLMGIEYDLIPFEMYYSQFISYNYACNKICRRHCQAKNDAEVTFGQGINVDFYNGTLVIEEGASLIIEDSVTFRAVKGANSLIVYGNLQIGENVNFIANEGASFFVDIRNPQLSLSFEEAYFDHISLSTFIDTLFINNSEFHDATINLYRSTDNFYSLTYSELSNTAIRAVLDEHITEDGTVNISDCSISNQTGSYVIFIDGFPNFSILRDTIEYATDDGICIHNSGTSMGGNRDVKNCTIKYEASDAPPTPPPFPPTHSGITVYHSYADIQNNLIMNNFYGVTCLDRSNVRLLGTESAKHPDETQRIINNDYNQVFTVPGSFPVEFEYNMIYTNNGDDSLVFYQALYLPTNKFLHVEYNFWGPDFDTVHDLIPSGKYYWKPVWIPSWIHPKSISSDESLFQAAEQAIIDGNYADAESDFKEIIENYPDSKYLQASVKELLALKRIYDHDFTGLKSYLDSVPTLQQDTETMNLTAHVSNWCNIENEDYITAINWFESQIENPPSFEDSIFAIIDLGYTYTLMDSTGNRSSSYVGRYPEYKFATRKVYERNREYLIDLLFKRSGNQPDDQPPINNDTTVFSLIQNFPNPFRDQTDIVFSIPTAARVSIRVCNVLGALVEVPYDEFVESGAHRFTWSPKNLAEGIYYYSLEVNNEKKDVKKMILLR
ncbi:MAG: T9SS type A sorting domain-containing protein [Bacteroidetes bacterium]|nr:T9SS type A sorting domain-containing protein [Bacteroidota bacterium]